MAERSDEGIHAALLFEGGIYRVDRPVLRYPAAALAQLGAEVRVVEYPDDADSRRPDSERFRSVVTASVEALTADAARVTLIGKSLGTAAMALLPDGLPACPADAIWLTPIFGYDAVAAGAKAKRWRSLYVYGTADGAHDEKAQSEVAAVTGGVEVAIDGADHGLEVEGDVLATVAGLDRLVRAVLGFVRAG